MKRRNLLNRMQTILLSKLGMQSNALPPRADRIPCPAARQPLISNTFIGIPVGKFRMAAFYCGTAK